MYRPVAARRARVLRDQPALDQPAGAPGQALRRHLIGVTHRLLAAHGLTGLTTRVIAREAEVSDGVLYNHFADKDDLIVAALTEQFAELFAGATTRCPSPGRGSLREGLDALLAGCLEIQSAILPLIGGLLAHPALLREVLNRLHAGDGSPHRFWEAMTDYLHAEQALGTVAADVHPETVAEVLFGVTHLHTLGLILGTEIDGGAAVVMPLRDRQRLVDFLLRACTAPTDGAGAASAPVA